MLAATVAGNGLGKYCSNNIQLPSGVMMETPWQGGISPEASLLEVTEQAQDVHLGRDVFCNARGRVAARRPLCRDGQARRLVGTREAG